MASADLREELTCSVCLNIYRDPVTLPCGHSFCQDCIENVLDTQGAREYSCPECRQLFNSRPDLQRALSLANMVKGFLSTHPGQEVVGMPCTHSAVPAGEHVLTEPTISLGNRKCSIHKKVLEYYCSEDASCIFVSCRLAGEHTEHQVETLNVASEKKETLRNILEILILRREEAEKRIQSLSELKREVQEKASGVTEEVIALIRGIREWLKALETERDYIKVWSVGDLGSISVTLHSGLVGIVTVVKRQRHVSAYIILGVGLASDMLLDVNTAGNNVTVSGDMKTVSWSDINQSRPETPERFQFNQILSSRSFSSGRHYWEVNGSKSGWWSVGVTYPSIDRKGVYSVIGCNNKSWCMYRGDNNLYHMIHDSNIIKLTPSASSQRLGLYLDYEAGRLSFYEFRDPIIHLHTFTATFTEPLHAIFRVYGDNAKLRISCTEQCIKLN
ncbi:nuclear factor 7, ovary-like [Pelobates fuscus]|uniref:nuclear factor 7, ovary-like n=1 Tax=Pelobates fuscus TaxID=191477 RepID=UPI002FE4AA28